jgi:hypothetical protein
MDKWNKIAALRLAKISLAAILLTSLLFGLIFFNNVIERFNRLKGFTGVGWLKSEYVQNEDSIGNKNWKKIMDHLNNFTKAAERNGSTKLTSIDRSWVKDYSKQIPKLILVEDFETAHNRNSSSASRRYEEKTDKELIRGDYDVNFSFGVMTKPANSKTNDEIIDYAVMNHIIAEAVDLYKIFNDKNKKNLSFTQKLAKALKLDFSDFDELGINSIYVGSDSGHAAFFPANDQLSPDLETGKYYNARTRPWYEAAINKSNQTEPDNPGVVGLSYQYLDYTEYVTMVRTAWKRFEINNKTYVVAIDLVLYGGGADSNILNNVKSELQKYAIIEIKRALLVGMLVGLLILIFAVLVLFGIFPKTAQYLAIGPKLRSEIAYDFERKEGPLYWQPGPTRILTETQTENTQKEFHRASSAESKLDTVVGGIINLGHKISSISSHQATLNKQSVKEYVKGPSNVTERCVDYWLLNEKIFSVRVCRHCRQQLNTLRKSSILSEMTVRYRDHDYVEVKIDRWDQPKDPDMNKDFAKNALSNHSAVGGVPKGNFRLSFGATNNRLIEIPPQVSNLKSIKRHVDAIEGIKKGRVGYSDGVSLGFPFYDGCSVDAVCDVWYLDQLLRRRTPELLKSGTHIRRIIFANSEDEIKNIYDNFQHEFSDLVEMTGQRLWYVLKEDMPEQFSGYNKWDFALLDYNTEQAVVMVSYTNQFHSSTVKEKSTGVKGELSWRKADLEFYHTLFEIMYTKKKQLTTLIDKYEVATLA